jgi:CrcB protein
MSAFLVFLGGGTGAVLRLSLSALFPTPWGTFTCNVIGSFLLAMLMHPAVGAHPNLRLLVGTGLLGGFTTYSTFNLDVLQLIRADDLPRAALVVGLTVAAALASGAAGWAMGGWLAGSR